MPLQTLKISLGLEALGDEPLLRALTHRSWAEEHGGTEHNQRLEFLGDAVLGLVVAEAFYRDRPDAAEGQLTNLRAALVKGPALGEIAAAIGLGAHLRLGAGEASSEDETARRKRQADALEALIGAVFEELGFDAARTLVRRLLDGLWLSDPSPNPKTALNELCQRLWKATARYESVETWGPPHRPSWRVEAVLPDGRRFEGRSEATETSGGAMTLAKEAAAEAALRALADAADDSGG